MCVQAEAFGTAAAAGEVMRQLLAAGVPTHLGFELTGWTLDPQSGQVTSVQARREDGEKLALDVDVCELFYITLRSIVCTCTSSKRD